MTDLSIIHAVLWLSLIVLVYWMLPERMQAFFLATASSAVLFYFDKRSFAILSIFALSIFFLRQWKASFRIPYIFPVVIILFASPFMFFKMRTDSFGLFSEGLIIPLGLSFYTLKLVHYWIEYSKGGLRKHTFLDFFNYLSFFPAVAAGPIHRFEEFYLSERRKRWDIAKFGTGLERILYGSCKIVILGNYLVSTQFHRIIEHIGRKHICLKSYYSCIEYGLNLYFQFAGYSDIAIGLGLVLGYKISENFSNPFLKPNIAEFWRSWHISLSEWCRMYIFLPVMAVSRKPAIAVAASMVVIGLWHKFNIQFIVWGIYHGAGIVLYHQFQRLKAAWLPVVENRYLSKAVYACAVLLNFNFVMLSFAITKEDSLADSLQVFHNILFSWM